MDTLYTAISLAGLLAWGMIFAATIVADVLIHDPRPQGAPAPNTGMTAGGVPYVHGPRQEGDPCAAHRTEGEPGVLAAAVHAP